MTDPRSRSSRHVLRQSSRSSHLGENIFSDENEIEGLGIADGYQPSFALQDGPSGSRRSSHHTPSLQNRTSPAREPKKKAAAALTQEVTQPLISRNSFSLQHDAQYSDPPRRIASISSAAEPTTLRPQSTLSRNSTFARPQSTYNGPSAPSHPYGMYPQNPNEPARRTSVASSHRPTRERSFMGAHRPQHPYGMYPQDTVSASETDALTASTDIASVGFPGLGRQQFARRLEPNGDDADDIIGPDGHTEQLPPYTRYPAAGVYKPMRLSSVPMSPILQEPSQTADSANSISDHVHYPDSPTSMRDPILQSHRQSLRTRERQSSRPKNCFGRMPLWMVIMIILLMVILGAVAGIVIGKFVSKHKQDSGPPPVTTLLPDATSGSSPAATSSSYATVSELSAPSAVPTQAAGQYVPVGGSGSLVISNKPEKSSACLNSTQQKAWGCAKSMDLSINITNPMGGKATITLTAIANPGSGPGSVAYYGDQTPSFVQGAISDAQLFYDPDDKDYGPAHYFHATYNKQVVLHVNDFHVPSKRSIDQQLENRIQRRDGNTAINNNDQVWNCLWGNTFMDGFIYVNQPSANTSASNPKPIGESKPNLSRIFFGHAAAINPYPEKVKIREFRQQQDATPAQCTLMLFNNGSLTDTAQPPITFNLTENSPQALPDTTHLHLFGDSSKRSHKRKHGSKNMNRDADDGGVESVFCACEWDFN